jgi:hypothetical protein
MDLQTLKRLIQMSSQADVVALRTWIGDAYRDDGRVTIPTIDSPFHNAILEGLEMKAFMSALGADDLTAVVYAHLHLENILEEMFRRAVSPAEPILDEDNYTFEMKKNALRRMALLSVPELEMLDAVNFVRNKFAHNLHTHLVDHEKRLVKSLPAGNREWLDRYMSLEGVSTDKGIRVRLAIFSIYDYFWKKMLPPRMLEDTEGEV